ncbi:hypothetical protein Clacol_005251 [Clathrus columnatus]|uniref:Uncharacterized protein n=1 Tax=Clathrus columnatus TaxID=1419009 RepID=A0AAV5ABQ9_9AGAM|nr:hypothetical protein Clacol_005251 [Clathrus columnatus]
MGIFRVSQWAPANETESNLIGERFLLDGPIIGAVGYGNGVNIVITQYAFIDDRDFPGGPLAYSLATSAIPVNVVGFVAYVINAWLQDGLLSIAPLVILLRVAQQRAWTRNTLKSMETHVDFVAITHQLTTQIDSSETRHGPLTTASQDNLPNSSVSDLVSEKVYQ